MVIQIIHKLDILLMETKNKPPVFIHPHRPKQVFIALQAMQLPTRYIHIFRRFSNIQGGQLDT